MGYQTDLVAPENQVLPSLLVLSCSAHLNSPNHISKLVRIHLLQIDTCSGLSPPGEAVLKCANAQLFRPH